MVLCKYWQKGNCRFGDRCKFEHPDDRNVHSNNSNPRKPYGNYQNINHSGSRGGLPYGLDKDAITADLTIERPQWILSSYGPGRNAPAQLFGGPLREQSFEEIRLLYYIAATSGNTQKAIQDASQLQRASEQQIENILRNIDGAISYIIEAEKEHPNRIDICKASHMANLSSDSLIQRGNVQSSNSLTANTRLSSTSTFGIPSTISGGTFGKPSVPIQSGSSFTALAGSKATPQLSASRGFGQPSMLGQKANPFSLQTTTVTNNSSNNPLPAQSSLFIPHPDSFTNYPQTTTGANSFDPRSQTPLLSQLGSSNNNSQNNPFTTSFGPNILPTQSNPFSSSGVSPSEQRFSNRESINPNTVINPSNNTPAVPTNKLPSIHQSHSPVSNGFSQCHVPSITRDSSGRLSLFKGETVQYRDGVPGVLRQNGKWEKIWFPDGPPPNNKDAELDDDAYDENTKASYLQVGKNGTFPGGVMPLLPPKLEWCSWDF